MFSVRLQDHSRCLNIFINQRHIVSRDFDIDVSNYGWRSIPLGKLSYRYLASLV